MNFSEHKAHILIVDDIPSNISMMAEILKNNHHIFVATNGANALETVKSQRIDLILLDIVMPDMDGYAVCEHLKSDLASKEIPIIFLTANDGAQDEERGLSLGAVDYITKPFNPGIVSARVKNQLDLKRSRDQLKRLTGELWQANKRLNSLNETLMEERGIIEDIVMKTRHSPLFHDQNLRVLEKSVDKTMGDIICSTLCPDGAQRVLLGDFTGHGLVAAIGSPLVSEIFYSDSAMGIPLDQMFKTLNFRLLHALREDMFMACCCLELNAARDQASLYNAGLANIYLYRQGKIIQNIPSCFVPRGLMDVPDDPGVTVSIQPGDKIIMCTDGLEEATNPKGEMFNESRSIQLLEETLSQNRPLTFLLEVLTRYRQGVSQQDDITLVEITC
ncbi:MAG: SpoIIE family protein phosphatase [Magnetococcales bacterium]|nr:SpoIIE family protein phosphatase [Magnetococcales bacterium]